MQRGLLCLPALVSAFLLSRPSPARAEIKLSDAEIEALAEEVERQLPGELSSATTEWLS